MKAPILSPGAFAIMRGIPDRRDAATKGVFKFDPKMGLLRFRLRAQIHCVVGAI